jgi:SET domain
VQDLAYRIHKAQTAMFAPRKVSVNGSARADGLDLVARSSGPRGPRVARILSKAVGDDTDNDNEGGEGEYNRGRGRDRDRATRDGVGRDEDDEEAEFDANRARFDEEEREASKREDERNQQRYFELSAAYLRDPLARLEVRRSAIHGGGLFVRDGVVIEKDEMIVEYIGEKIRQAVADRREAQYEDEGVGSCYLFRLDKESIIDATRRGGMARFINHSCEPNAYAKVITTVSKKKVIRGHKIAQSSSSVPHIATDAATATDGLQAMEVSGEFECARPTGEGQLVTATATATGDIGITVATSATTSADVGDSERVVEVEDEDEDEAEDEDDVEDRHIVIFAGRDILGGEEVTYDYKFPIEEKKLKCYCGAPRCLGSMN